MNNIGDNSTSGLQETQAMRNRSNTEISLLGRKIMTMKFEKKGTDHKFSITDLNNFIGADRKIVINDSNEFWVHDAALLKTSNFFKSHFTSEKPIFKETTEIKNEIAFKKTFIYIPHPEFFFDVLTWIYTKDDKRISLAADETESFLSILNLGIYLEMNDEFFKTLLENCEIKLDEELLTHHLWSRFSFTFEVLKNLLSLMPKENYLLKMNAILAWLKEDNSRRSSKQNETIQEKDFELLTSSDFFRAKKFLAENKFLNNLNVKELFSIKQMYPNLIPALDTSYLIERFISKTQLKIKCKVCRKASNNIQEFVKNDCEIKMYHPKCLANYQRQLISQCEHENCKRKFSINEFSCCHKGPHVEGCMMNDGKHVMQIDIITGNTQDR